MSSPPGEAQGASPVALASMTDVGQVRTANEDSCDVLVGADGAHLLVVADGMGGHRGGATASGAIVTTIAEVFGLSSARTSSEPTRPRDADGLGVGQSSEPNSPARMLRAAIQAANARVYAMAQQDPALEGMGSTVVAFLLRPDLRATVAHVGDSRAYRLRQGSITPITMDHSVVAEMQRQGLLTADEAANHPRRNEILRSVGVLPQVEIDVAEVEVRPGDRFLLCSDGLSGVVSDEEMAAIAQAEPPDQAVQSLIRLANERGGPDNITVQILSIPADALIGTDPEATADVEISIFGMEQIEAMRRTRSLRRVLVVAIGLAALGAAAYYALRPVDVDPTSKSRPTDSARPSPGASPSQVGDGTESERESSERESGESSDRRAAPSPSPQTRPAASQAMPSPEPLQESSPAAEAGPESGPESGARPGAAPADQDATSQDQFEIDRPAPRRGVPRNEVPAN